VDAGPLDVGLTANVTPPDPEFRMEAHFDWVVFVDGLSVDGCGGALERLKIEEGE